MVKLKRRKCQRWQLEWADNHSEQEVRKLLEQNPSFVSLNLNLLRQ